MKSDNLDQVLHDALSGTAPAEVHEGTRRHFDELAARLQSQQPARSPVRERHPLWWLWPGIGLAGAAAVIVLAVSFLFTPTVSWAQVEEKFRTLRFFNITMYVTDSWRPLEKIEVWASRDHRCRVHHRGLIFFGQEGKLVKILRARSGEEVTAETLREEARRKSRNPDIPDPDTTLEMALAFAEKYSTAESFSITEVVKRPGDQMHPLPNLDASIASDMQVFDFTESKYSVWNRLWVLKKSELPVRSRFWNPDNGEQIETLYDYFTEMPDEAFDAEKVKAAIAGKQGTTNKLYALLKDPGKRPLTPEDSFAQTGNHLPEIESAGRTEEGVFWVLSKNAVNRTPVNSGDHFGWGVVTDNLGQKYAPSSVIAPFGENGDRLLEYYIPLDYRGEYRRPQSYTLTCVVGDDYSWPGTAGGTVVGSVPVKEWKDNAPIPEAGRQAPPDATDLMELAMYRLSQLKDWDRFDRLAAQIPGEAAEGGLALFRDMKLIEKLDSVRQREAAMALRARIYPLLKPRETDRTFEEKGEVMAAYMADLLRAGKRDEARKVANESVAALVSAKQYYRVTYFVHALHRAGMSETEVRQFFDMDVFKVPYMMEEVEREKLFVGGRPGEPATPPRVTWRAYVSKLAARYDHEQPPAEFEFIDEQPALIGGFWTIPLPGHEGYAVTLLAANSNARSVARRMAQPMGVDPLQVVVPPAVVKKLRGVVCVHRQDAKWTKIWPEYLQKCGLEISETNTPRKVLVAHYDGRKLPFPPEVFPINGKSRGWKSINSENGTELAANHVFVSYQEALNFGLDAGDPRLFIINETGLSETARPNQTYPDSYLSEQNAFWSGTGADASARDWFRDNFGITFQEEERPLRVIELRPLP